MLQLAARPPDYGAACAAGKARGGARSPAASRCREAWAGVCPDQQGFLAE